jgi:hypothetical protein
MAYTKEQFTAYCVDNFIALYESEIDDEFTFEHYYKLLLEMSLEELRDELPCKDDELAEVMEGYLEDPQAIIKSYLS